MWNKPTVKNCKNNRIPDGFKVFIERTVDEDGLRVFVRNHLTLFYSEWVRVEMAFRTALLAVALETVPLLGADCTFLVVEDLLAGDFLLVAMEISIQY